MNYLRNVALKQVQTEYIFLTDVDFLPMKGLHANLKKQVVNQNMENTKKVSLVMVISVGEGGAEGGGCTIWNSKLFPKKLLSVKIEERALLLPECKAMVLPEFEETVTKGTSC